MIFMDYLRTNLSDFMIIDNSIIHLEKATEIIDYCTKPIIEEHRDKIFEDAYFSILIDETIEISNKKMFHNYCSILE